MKTRISIAMACLALFFSAELYALDAMLGVKSGYFVWRPYYQDMEGSGVENMKEGTGFLYGPVFSLGLTNNLSFSFVGLYGKQSTYWDDNENKEKLGTTDIKSTGTAFVEITRIDLDSAISYNILENFKVFIGYKYQSTETDLRQTLYITEITTGNDQVFDQSVVMEGPAHGPALGVGLTKTLGSNFFASANLSALYMRSVFNYKNLDVTFYQATAPGHIEPDPPFIVKDLSFKSHQIGLNVEGALGMSVEPIVVTLGARFQWMRYKFLEDVVIPTSPPARYSWDWCNDYLYGIFVSVLYML